MALSRYRVREVSRAFPHGVSMFFRTLHEARSAYTWSVKRLNAGQSFAYCTLSKRESATVWAPLARHETKGA